jgi:hypothetical protein
LCDSRCVYLATFVAGGVSRTCHESCTRRSRCASGRRPTPALEHVPALHSARQPGTRDAPATIAIHPCRCLCRGSAQTTKTTPRRLTILHFSHIRRTLARTFMDELVTTAKDGLEPETGLRTEPQTIGSPQRGHKGVARILRSTRIRLRCRATLSLLRQS